MAIFRVGSNKFTVSSEDVNRVLKYKWRKDKQSGYWYAYNKNKKLYLHRYITNNNTENPTDHIDGNKNNNTRENLRICTRAANARNQGIKANNRTGYKNIFINGKKYVLQARMDGKTKTFGRFDNVNDALKIKMYLWDELFNLDYKKEIYRATMSNFGIDKDIQDIVIDEFFGDESK
jgi:hypothetical protein|nr:MAG TPA: homing endonuclease [Caudoviricetes sp.]